ncbi:M48 family metalloprotease [Stappia sp. F7233]|uniref:M48 family metalloprotease n=1 Tax=Stappia albiluteola TaxID=2758565 RepID=A0A839AHZ1_9HYPH|nr:M48 family metalloprotease [Stappia albiluteola]
MIRTSARLSILQAVLRFCGGLHGLGVFAGRRIAAPVLLSAFVAGCQLYGSEPISIGTPAPGQLRPSLANDLGAREHPRVVATYGGVYEDPGAERAVAQVVGRLVAASDDPSRTYRVTILNSPAVNAFALPGGYLYVTRGLLALANDTSEVAAVLAHEMAHVTANHAIERQQRAEATELAGRVLSNVVRNPDQARAALVSSQLSFARFSQVQELKADVIGVQTLARAGYDPFAAARFLNTMGRFSDFQSAKGDSNTAPDFLSSHPSTPERVTLAVRAARQVGAPGIGERDRDAYLTKIDGMLFGDDPLEGFTRGRSFLHKALGIGFTVPEGFLLENSPEAVLASNAAGTAVRFDGADLTKFDTLTSYMTSGWINGLIPQSVREETINGLPAVTASAITDGWSFRIAVIRIGRTGYRFIFASRNPDDAFMRAYEQTVQSFRQLTPTERARLRPLRIKIIRADAGDTAEKLAIGMSGVEAARRLELFSILNQVEPGASIPAGTPLKLIID